MALGVQKTIFSVTHLLSGLKRLVPVGPEVEKSKFRQLDNMLKMNIVCVITLNLEFHTT